jgi:hypothetical protein
MLAAMVNERPLLLTWAKDKIDNAKRRLMNWIGPLDEDKKAQRARSVDHRARALVEWLDAQGSTTAILQPPDRLDHLF